MRSGGGQRVERGDDVRDGDRAAGPQHARHLRDGACLVGERAQRALRQRDVERRVGERQRLGVAVHEAHAVGQPGGAGRALGALDRLRAQVDADHLCSEFAREQERGRAGAAGHVDHPVSGRELGELGEAQGQALAARVQLAVEQPLRGVALVQPGAAGLRIALEVEDGELDVHASAPRTCSR